MKVRDCFVTRGFFVTDKDSVAFLAMTFYVLDYRHCEGGTTEAIPDFEVWVNVAVRDCFVTLPACSCFVPLNDAGCVILIMQRGGCVYIMTNIGNTTLYTGVTSDLYSRVVEHKEGKYPDSFTSRYNLKKLVYYEVFRSIKEAIDREKQIKGGSRVRKESLINSMNPEWRDLFEDIKGW